MCEMCELRKKFMMASSMMASKENEDSDPANAVRRMVLMSTQSIFGVVALAGDVPREKRIAAIEEIKRFAVNACDEVYQQAIEKINEKQPEGTGGDNVIRLH